ncbi:MAG: phosphoribosyltransferase family protein [Micrococcaceae bacterium]
MEIFFPDYCAMCKKLGEKWCATCKAQFLDYRPALSIEDRVPFPLWYYADYSAGFDTLIKSYKSAGRTDLVPFLSVALARTIEAIIAKSALQKIILVPMPSTKHRVKTRGYDHISLVAKAATKLIQNFDERVVFVPALKQSNKTAQASVNANNRKWNVHHTMWVSTGKERELKHLPNAQIILIDDICTTGATLIEGARALKSVGISVSGAAVLATVCK